MKQSSSRMRALSAFRRFSVTASGPRVSASGPRVSASGPRVSASRRARHGFTLLEIIVVVTIIALLATLIAPRLLNRIGQSKIAVARAEVNEIRKQVQLWCVDNGLTRPTDDFELSLLTSGADPYIKAKDLIDPWGREYVILIPGEQDPAFDVISWGADGQPGGDGENADIYSE